MTLLLIASLYLKPQTVPLALNMAILNHRDEPNWEAAFLRLRNGTHILAHGNPKGRTGNQLFILASLLGLAYKNNMALHLTAHFNHLKQIFKMNITRRLPVARSFDKLNATVVNLKAHLMNPCPSEVLSLGNRHNNVLVLNHYLQCFSFFEEIKNFLFGELQFQEEIRNKTHTFLEKSTPTEWIVHNNEFIRVGIHVRRGDFLHGQNAALVPGKEYFAHAMAYFDHRYDHVMYFVASNDIHWCEANINASNIIFSSLKTPAEDLSALVHCDHVILSCGTFSWWAGYLNRGSVVYYKHSIKPNAHLNASIYFPREWIGME